MISDTGGGHRSAANAIGAALDEIGTPYTFETRIDDVAAHCTFPLTQLGLGYSMALRYAPPVYGALYYATNGRRRYKALVRFCEPLYRERLRDLFIDYQPDVIVSVHPLLNHAALRARADAHMQHVPIVTVITDLGKVHESWLVPDADAVVVPAREVYQRALSRGVPPARLRLLGHPIHPQFDDVSGSKAALRAKLGLPTGTPIVMLMAGGEGGGKLLSTTLALAQAKLPIDMVVVCGRNEALKQKLTELSASLPTPMHVLGFPNNIPDTCAPSICWSPKPVPERWRKPRCSAPGHRLRLRPGPRARQRRLRPPQRSRHDRAARSRRRRFGSANAHLCTRSPGGNPPSTRDRRATAQLSPHCRADRANHPRRNDSGARRVLAARSAYRNRRLKEPARAIK